MAAKHVARLAGLTLVLGLPDRGSLGRGRVVASEGMVAREVLPLNDCVDVRGPGWSVGDPGRALAKRG